MFVGEFHLLTVSIFCLVFSYNPSKFADRDDDLSDMEANFEDIMREEKRR